MNTLHVTGDITTDHRERSIQEMKNFDRALHSSANSDDVDKYFESTAEPQITKGSQWIFKYGKRNNRNWIIKHNKITSK